MKKKTISFTLIFIAVVITIVLVVISGKKKDANVYTTAKVEYGTLVQTVGEVGTIKASKGIELNFSRSGKINKVYVKSGDKVDEGGLLLELDYDSLNIRKQEAEASLNIAKANLNKLLSGATNAEIAVSDANVSQAKSAYQSAVDELAKTETTNAENVRQAEKDLFDLTSKLPTDLTTQEKSVSTAEISLANIKATYSQSIDNQEKIALITTEDKLAAANTTLDKIDKLITDKDLEGELSVMDSTVLDEAKRLHNQSIGLLKTANATLAMAKIDDAYVEKALDDALAALNETYDTVSMCIKALENSITSVALTEVILSNKKADIRSEQLIVSSGVSAVKTIELNLSDAKLTYSTRVSEAEDVLENAKVALSDAVKNAENRLSTARKAAEQQSVSAQARVDSARKSLEVAEARLSQVKSPARNEDISLAKSQVQQAEAQLDLIKKDIDNSILKAPISGQITDVAYEVGEQTAAKSAIKMLGENNYTIEVDVSEADIAKIVVGNDAVITLDAFGDDIEFSGETIFIEPAETVIQDVTYYRVTLDFTEDIAYNQYYDAIKPGMTANITIKTIEKENVLLAPSRAIVERNGGSGMSGKFLRVLKNGKMEEVSVKTGIRGDEGVIELLTNIDEGTEVVTYVKEE